MVLANEGLAKIAVRGEQLGQGHVVGGSAKGQEPPRTSGAQATFNVRSSFQTLDLGALDAPAVVRDLGPRREVGALQGIPFQHVAVEVDAEGRAWWQQDRFGGGGTRQVFPPREDGVDVDGTRPDVHVAGKGPAADELGPGQVFDVKIRVVSRPLEDEVLS